MHQTTMQKNPFSLLQMSNSITSDTEAPFCLYIVDAFLRTVSTRPPNPGTLLMYEKISSTAEIAPSSGLFWWLEAGTPLY